MAKKANGFNMAAEIRALLTADRSMTGRQVLEALKKKFPSQKINENSLSVAFSGARKKVGIKKTVRRRKPDGRKKAARRRKAAVKSASTSVSLDALRAAKPSLAACGGDTEAAIDAVRQLGRLQIS